MASVPLPSQALSAEEPGSQATGIPVKTRFARVPVHALCGAVLAVAGIAILWPTVLLLWSLWTTDPLKSIGGFVPIVSFVLLLRSWRALGWETRGSWWGLAVLAVTAAVVAVRDRAVLELVLGPSWSITLPPHSVVAVAYASGVVLLLGGGRLWRAAWFPVVLMWFVNPVPHVLNRWVDLPLQHASAEVARGLAHALGQRLTPDQLYLMFTPDFGMFIAPGCDGIRGSITMGLLALVAGYLYQFRLRVWAAVVAAAVLLGYIFNLLRLCVLVLYYVLALHWRPLQAHAEMADYLLGATLFFFAAMLLFAAIRRCSADGTLRLPPVRAGDPAGSEVGAFPSGFWARATAFAILAAVCALPYARGALTTQRTGSIEAAKKGFPEAVGAYRLQRTWSEKLETGQTIFEWAAYSAPGAEGEVQVGVSPVLGAHDTLLCHTARGEDWLWHGTLTVPTSDGPVNLSGSFFDDGMTRSLEATTVCSEAQCGQWASERTHFGLVYSRPGIRGWDDRTRADARPIPVMLVVASADRPASDAEERSKLTAKLAGFLRHASFELFTYRYRQP